MKPCFLPVWMENIDLDRAGVIWGTGIGGFETIEHDLTEAALLDRRTQI
jgi:hypothetical protein